MFSARAIEPLGEALPNTEIFRRIAARMGLEHPELQESDESMMRQALRRMPFTLEELRERSSIRLPLPSPHRPYARGARLPTPSGRIEIASQRAVAAGLDLLPEYVPPYESEERNPELVRRYPLALLSPPAHSFLNSTFVNVASLRRAAGKPTLEIHADDAGARGIAGGAQVAIYNDRGTFTAEAVITDRVRPGVVSAPSVWWPKLTADRANANHTTSQAVTDIGGGATFYDNQVEVRPA
jgi:anaerobic selenocysteine-containing dehydrogenase